MQLSFNIVVACGSATLEQDLGSGAYVGKDLGFPSLDYSRFSSNDYLI